MSPKKKNKANTFPNRNVIRMEQSLQPLKEIESDDSASDWEKSILMDYIVKNRAKVIVEIGTHRGLTALALGIAAEKVGGRVHTYDPYEWNAEDTFSKFPDLPIVYYKRPALECEVEDIDFLFVDGYHQKEYVLEEIDYFWPRLSKKAVVVFHDAGEPNEGCNIPGALEERRIEVEYIQTENVIAVYDRNTT